MYVNNRLERKWTAQDDVVFKELWGFVHNSVVCNKFGVTEAAASQHAWKLGLSSYGKRSPDPDMLAPLGELEFAPGHVAVDQQSYDLLRRARAIR